MKPNWEDAPKWANWLVQNDNGDWFWYEERPKIEHSSWRSITGMWKIAGHDWNPYTILEWKQSLEQRPTQ